LKYIIKYLISYKMEEQITAFDIITKHLKLMNKQIKSLEKENNKLNKIIDGHNTDIQLIKGQHKIEIDSKKTTITYYKKKLDEQQKEIETLEKLLNI